MRNCVRFELKSVQTSKLKMVRLKYFFSFANGISRGEAVQMLKIYFASESAFKHIRNAIHKVSLDPWISNWFYLLRKLLASKVIQTIQPSTTMKTTMENGLHGKFDILVEAQALALALALAHRYGKIYKLFARPTHLFHVLESRESSISPSQATRTRFSKAFPNSVPIHHTKHLGNDSLYILLRFPMKIKLLIHFGVFLRADNSFESATVRWKNVSYQSSPIYLFICWYTSCLFCVNLNQCAMLVQILFSSFFPHSSFELTRLL